MRRKGLRLTVPHRRAREGSGALGGPRVPQPAYAATEGEAMHVIAASDSFKGTLSSEEIAQLLAEEASAVFPDARVTSVPMADGGEGTAAALVAACGGELRRVRATDPLGRPVNAAYGLLWGQRAVIEVAAASGLPLLAPAERDPFRASSYGTGQLLRAALDAGVTSVTLALGGSATNDGGMGMLRALGVRFLDQRGCELAGCGADLARVARIDLTGLDPRLGRAHIQVMCDVDNPLTGPQGASAVFGPQKGATPSVVAELDAGMESYAACVREATGVSVVNTPGAGAAGGIGAACLAFLGARLRSGVEAVLDLAGFDELLAQADVVVTGEGRADGQTARGKVVSGVAAACLRRGVPCVAVVGGMEPGADRLPGLTAMVPTAIDPAEGLESALAHAEERYRAAARRLFQLVALGRRVAG